MRLRNPFRLRLAEHIESDTTFLRLFESSVLEALPDSALRQPLLVLRSAPGGGKTSILRLFSPSVLRTLVTHREQSPFRELADRLQRIGAISTRGLEVVGVRISCGQSFADVDALSAPSPRPERLLFSLLNARIVIAAMREMADYMKGRGHDALSQVRLNISAVWPSGLGADPKNAEELLAWAVAQEAAVCAELDALTPAGGTGAAPGQDRLLALSLLEPERLQPPGAERFPAMLIQLDDFHLLTNRQRQRVLDAITTLRSGTPVWLAERLEAIEGELVQAQTGRDGTTIHLEAFWSERSPRKVEQFMLNVADRRSQSALDVEVQSFEDCLQSRPSVGRWKVKTTEALALIRNRVVSGDPNGVYRRWRAEVEERSYVDNFEEAVTWRALEIHIARDQARTQRELFSLPREPDLLEEREAADIRTAAELFLCTEMKLPFYYGGDCLARLASRNVDQFLEIAGDLFEEVVSASVLRQALQLSAERQDDIIRRVARRWFDGLASRVRHGQKLLRFLGSAARMAREETFRPTAPYAPGVTGFAYAASEHEDLERRIPELAGLLENAVAENVLSLNANARVKGRDWMVFYFNRLLCAHFGLPVQFGGFREQRMGTLQRWLGGANSVATPQGTLPFA